MKILIYYFLPLSLILFSCSIDRFLTEETTAVYLSYYDRNHHHITRWIYNVHNTPYSESPNTFHVGNRIDGQACYIKYDPYDPSIFTAIESKPIFYTDEQTTLTKAKTLKVPKRRVRFTYYADKKRYHYFQLTDKKIMEFKKGDSIQIEYWNKNPKRSIILFKNPTYEAHVKRHH